MIEKYMFTIAMSIIIGFINHYILLVYKEKYAKKTKTRFDDILVKHLLQPIIVIWIVIGAIYGVKYLDLSAGEMYWYYNILAIMLGISLGIFFNNFGRSIIKEYLIPKAKATKTKLDDLAYNILLKSWSFIVFSIILIIILYIFQIKLQFVIIAYLIIVLIALSLSINKIDNIIAYTEILTQEIFTIDDIVKIAGHYGRVKEITPYYTILENEEKRVYIPNKLVIKATIEKIKK